MKKTFTKLVGRFTTKASSSSTKQTMMTSVRFFPNPVPDLTSDSLETVNIPTESLIAAINTITEKVKNYLKPVLSNAGDGLYLGTGGVAYMYYHLSRVPTLSEHHSEYLQHAVDYLNPALSIAQKNERRRSELPAFLLGNCGIYAVAAAIFKAVGDTAQSHQYIQRFYEIANICKEMQFLHCGSDELFVGRAGYLLGAIWLARQTSTSVQKHDLYDICRVMMASGREYAQRHRSPSPLMYAYYDVEYLGAGHGLCSILQALMTVPEYLDTNPADAKDVKASVDYLLSLQDNEGNFPAATDEIRNRQNELVHWCHGAGGIVYLMAKAYLMWHEDKYLRSCKKSADLIWQKGLLKKGPGLCHGIAGNGYVFLLMYRLTEDVKYLHRAISFFQFMETDEFKVNARTPDYPYSLYEGLAGTACFLGDLTDPAGAAFPFSDVF